MLTIHERAAFLAETLRNIGWNHSAEVVETLARVGDSRDAEKLRDRIEALQIRCEKSDESWRNLLNARANVLASKFPHDQLAALVMVATAEELRRLAES